MRRPIRRIVVGAAIVAFALIASACGSGDDGTAKDGPTITIGSANFSENALIAEIYAQALEADGYAVERKFNIGNREIYGPALESGELDLVPEYIGSALFYVGGTPVSDSETTHSALRVGWESRGVEVLDYAPAQDKNGFAVMKETADSLGLAKVSDLAAHNGTLVLGGPPECPEREFCLKGLESIYGLSFAEFRPLDAGGPITVAALEGGEIQVGLMFTSDGTILAKGFVLLEDDKGLQPAENVAPAVRKEIVDAYGDDFKKALNEVSKRLTTAELVSLNKFVGIDGQDPEKVAAEWLKAIGVVQ
ncbi:MAG: ABC transporter substrate-binding protein [Actinomycetota bacterium]